MFICCAMVTTGDGDGEPNNFDHLLFPFCPANVRLFGTELSSGLAMLSGLPNSPGMEFNMSGCLSEKFQVGNAWVLVLTVGV